MTLENLASIVAQLERRMDVHQDRLDRMDTIPATLEAIDRRLWERDNLLAELSRKLDANTLITADIRDAQVAGRVISNGVKWFAGVVLGVAGLWAAMRGFRV